MATSCRTSEYFSGQGSVLMAEKHATTGEPLGFRDVGNITGLELSFETEIFEHTESCTGARGTDLSIVQSITVNATLVLESLDRENLALALYGNSALDSGTSVTDQTVTGYHGLWMPLGHTNITDSTVVVADEAGVSPATTYTEGTDYDIDYGAGMILVYSTGDITDEQTLYIDYTYGDQNRVEGIVSSAAPERWLRFNGLNTVKAPAKSLVVDLFRVSVQPLTSLQLINEELAEMSIELTVLADTTRSSSNNQSQYMRVRGVPF